MAGLPSVEEALLQFLCSSASWENKYIPIFQRSRKLFEQHSVFKFLPKQNFDTSCFLLPFASYTNVHYLKYTIFVMEGPPPVDERHCSSCVSRHVGLNVVFVAKGRTLEEIEASLV